MKVDSLKHKEAKRVHIPSKQEAGIEPVPEQVVVEFPLNRVIHRGQDPELHWLDKYGVDNREANFKVDIRSLYRHEHIAPEVLIKRLYRIREDGVQGDLFINDLFGNALQVDELEKPGSYYRHTNGWTNRLIQGDSLLVMTSLLEREGMAGKVQMIYTDPPYGIKYGSNWQMRLNDRNVKNGDDASLTGEPTGPGFGVPIP
jgi:adenine-specific DNA-methyltransferase